MQEDNDAAFARSSMMDDIDAVDDADAAAALAGDADTYGAEADEVRGVCCVSLRARVMNL